MDVATVVACGESSEVLEFVETALDAVSEFVLAPTVSEGMLARRICVNDGLGTDVLDISPKGAAVLGGVSEQGFGLETPVHCRSLNEIVLLSGRQSEAQRRPSASASMWTLMIDPPQERPKAWFYPPFPVAAC